MKSIHLNKLSAIMGVKAKAMFSKNFIIMPIFAIGFTILMRFVYGNASDHYSDMAGYVLGLGAVMNVGMVGVYCVSAGLAEEKEKFTLRTLMTSSVNGIEFFLGSIIPVVIMMVVINFVLIPISGCQFSGISDYLIYGLVSLIGSITSCMIGMIIGIFAKNQVSASTLTTPFILILMMIPMLSSFNKVSEFVSKYIFTGVLMNVTQQIADGSTNSINYTAFIVLVVEIIISIITFMLIYKNNGFEKN